jgi:hypothetical protein
MTIRFSRRTLINLISYVRHTEQLQQLFTDIFVDFNMDRMFANPFEALYKDAEPNL